MPVMCEENIYECVGMLSKPMQRGKQMFFLLKYTKWSYLGKCQIPVIVKLLSVKGLIPKYTPELSNRIITPEFSGTEHLLQVFLQAIKKEDRCLMKLFSPYSIVLISPVILQWRATQPGKLLSPVLFWWYP